MTAESTDHGGSRVEIDLQEATISLTNVWVDVDDGTLAFQVEGEIRDVDAETMDRLSGKQVEPLSVLVSLHESGN